VEALQSELSVVRTKLDETNLKMEELENQSNNKTSNNPTEIKKLWGEINRLQKENSNLLHRLQDALNQVSILKKEFNLHRKETDVIIQSLRNDIKILQQKNGIIVEEKIEKEESKKQADPQEIIEDNTMKHVLQNNSIYNNRANNEHQDRLTNITRNNTQLEPTNTASSPSSAMQQ